MDKSGCTCGKKKCDCNGDVKMSGGVDKGNKLGDYTVTLSAYWDESGKRITKEVNDWKLKMENKNPYVPKVIYSDPFYTTIVEWEDGDKTKVTCAAEDTYSWEAGYYAALAIKVLANGKKADMKNKWLPVLSRRVKEVRILSTGSTGFKKITPLPYGKWEDERKRRKELKKAEKEEEAKNAKKGKKRSKGE